MKCTLFLSMVVSMLVSSPALAYYDGVPYYGTYSSYGYGADRFYDVNDRYNTHGGQ
jgi:hypothetical protein